MDFILAFIDVKYIKWECPKVTDLNNLMICKILSLNQKMNFSLISNDRIANDEDV